MDPLTVLHLVGALVFVLVCWCWFFDRTPLLGPWFRGRYMLWLDRDGIHLRKGHRR